MVNIAPFQNYVYSGSDLDMQKIEKKPEKAREIGLEREKRRRKKKKILDFSFLQPHPGPMAEGQLLSTIILLITKLGERTSFAPAACVWPEHGLRPSASFLTKFPKEKTP